MWIFSSKLRIEAEDVLRGENIKYYIILSRGTPVGDADQGTPGEGSLRKTIINCFAILLRFFEAQDFARCDERQWALPLDLTSF